MLQRDLLNSLSILRINTGLYRSLLVTITCCGFLELSAQHDLKLWYDKPATKWTEALPIGNGRIGGMVFGGVDNDRIQINEETLWTGEPRNYNRTGASQYLDSIRQLLFAGKQSQAEALAEKHFMGMKSKEGDKTAWMNEMLTVMATLNNPSLEKYDDSKWKKMTVPSYEGWEAVGFEGLDGAVWLRTSFDLPPEWNAKNIILDLNRIRDHDVTFINGKKMGATATTEPRKYVIPAEFLHPGNNTLAIYVLNYFDKGGVAGYKDTSRHIGIYPQGGNEKDKRSLNGQWSYFIQDDEPPALGRYQADYQPFGDLGLQFHHTHPINNYRRALDISTAISSTSYTTGGVTFNREYFVSEPAQLMMIHLAASEKGQVNFDALLSSPHKNSSVRIIDKNTIALAVQVRNGALRGESFLRVEAIGGKTSIIDNRFVIENADEVTISLAAATNFRNYHDVTGNPISKCVAAMKKSLGKNFAAIKDAHVKEYQQYFNRMSVSFGKNDSDSIPTDRRLEKFSTTNDPSFAALYLQYGRYLLISSSRPGTQPANLQGIWNDLLAPPWGSKYTTNINAEMNYWPAELLNLSPLHEPLFNMIDELATTGRETAKQYYNAPGWVLHHNTDLWRGTAPINASNHGIWVTGGAWLSQHLWEHYLFTGDEKFLRDRAYPIMKDAAAFFQSFLIKDPTSGWLISTPSNSPEQGGLVAGPTMDHQLIRQLFRNVIDASLTLNTDEALRTRLIDLASKIAPNQIGKYGQLQEWLEDRDDTTNKHRHISHLWAAYPGSEINWDQSPNLMNAARQSLLYRGDEATGWSLGWKINAWARFRDGDHVYKLIKMLISPVRGGAGSYPNLFDAHPPFQIDGNFGGAAGMGEMLLQSHTGIIDLLPALPTDLPDGEIKGICARGGFVIDMKWNEGKLAQLTLHSTKGNACRIRYNREVIKLQTKKNGSYNFNGQLQPIQ